MLLGRDDVNPDKPDNDGQTPLCIATWNEWEGVVKILLGRDHVNPTDQIARAEHHSSSQLLMGGREW